MTCGRLTMLRDEHETELYQSYAARQLATAWRMQFLTIKPRIIVSNLCISTPLTLHTRTHLITYYYSSTELSSQTSRKRTALLNLRFIRTIACLHFQSFHSWFTYCESDIPCFIHSNHILHGWSHLDLLLTNLRILITSFCCGFTRVVPR